MLTGAWYYLASSNTALAIAALMVGYLVLRRYHRLPDGSLSRARLATVLLLAASTYTFLVCFAAEVMFHGPHLHEVIRDGFGDSRVAWLLFFVIVEAGIRLADEYRPHR